MFFTQNPLFFTVFTVKILIKVTKNFKNFLKIGGASNTFFTSTLSEGASNRGRASNMGGASIMGRGLYNEIEKKGDIFNQHT